MAITFTVPATTVTDTIVARLTSDGGNLVSVNNNDFSLRRADTGAEVTATISNRKAGNHFWDITVQNTGTYRGRAYIQIRRNAFIELATTRRIPSSPLNSNTFVYVLPAPANFIASDGVNTAVLRWDVVSGSTYELRVDSGLWQDVTSPHTVTGLLPDTEYVYGLRVKGDSNAIATVRKRTLVYPIEDIDEQFIPVGTQNYELIIGIRGQHEDARVNGLQEGFYQHFENLSDGNSRLYVRSEEVTRLIAQAIWSVQVSDTDWRVTKPIIYNVVPVSPILEDPGRQTLWIGVPFRLLVETLNVPVVRRGESELVGLKFESVELEGRSYISSAGTLPVGTELTFDAFNSDYYVENPGGSDTLQVPIDIRDDPDPPVINTVSNITRDSGYAAFTFEVSISAGTLPVSWSIAGIEGATVVSTGDMTADVTVPARLSAGTYTATLTASNGRFEDTEQFSVIVRPRVVIVRPTIRAISNISRTEGYRAFFVQATLQSGSTSVWSVSGSGATIDQNGRITVPQGLSAGTHNITVRADNSAGFDTERFSLVVSVAGVSPSGSITLAATPGDRQVSLSWNHPSRRGTPTATYRVYRGNTLVTTVSGTSYVDTGRINGTSYSYRVQAFNSAGSVNSNTVSAIPSAPRAPSGTIRVSVSYRNGQVSINWNHPSDRGSPAATYTILRLNHDPRPPVTNTAGNIATGLTGTSFIDRNITSGFTYRYYVQADNPSPGRIQSEEGNNVVTIP